MTYEGEEGVGDFGPVHPPTPLLVAAGSSVAVAAALFPLSLLPTHIIGYLLGSFVTITLVAQYRTLTQRRRRNPYFSPRPGELRVATGLLVLGTVVAAAHVWVIATHLSS